jgi:uncharacterized protein YijF (DUF1287 family)
MIHRRFASLLILATFVAARPAGTGAAVAVAAKSQVGVTRSYDPSYVALHYPNGDVPLDRGVCADVVIRAFRGAGIDLQREVHEDMRAHFAVYPRMWGLSAPDTNIDHRRVPNLMKFFERHGRSVAGDFLAGDVVAWRLPNGLYHIGVVAAERASTGPRPLVIHNIGYGAQEEDVLYAFTIIGHYRW